MKPSHTFTINVGPNTQWVLRVVVWPNIKDLRAARGRYHRDEGNTVMAFCATYDYSKAFKDADCVCAEVHLSRKDAKLAYVVHECLHALLHYCRIAKLKIHEADYDGEEWLAETMEYMVDGVVRQLRKLKVRVR